MFHEALFEMLDCAQGHGMELCQRPLRREFGIGPTSNSVFGKSGDGFSDIEQIVGVHIYQEVFGIDQITEGAGFAVVF